MAAAADDDDDDDEKDDAQIFHAIAYKRMSIWMSDNEEEHTYRDIGFNHTCLILF